MKPMKPTIFFTRCRTSPNSVGKTKFKPCFAAQTSVFLQQIPNFQGSSEVTFSS